MVRPEWNQIFDLGDGHRFVERCDKHHGTNKRGSQKIAKKQLGAIIVFFAIDCRLVRYIPLE